MFYFCGMIRIKDKVVSQDIFDVHFACDLSACKGACCVKGDAGAPLEKEECEKLEEIYPEVAPYLPEKAREVIEQEGKWTDWEGQYETPLLEGKECVYVVFEEGTAFCGIEQAWQDGKIDFQKPISCHLYPVRISHLGSIDVDAINYDQWSICNAACYKGEQLGLPLYRFLKAPLTRKYGTEFYNELDEIYVAWQKQKQV